MKLANILIICFVYFHDGGFSPSGWRWHLVNADKIIAVTEGEVKIKGAMDIELAHGKANDIAKEIFSQIKKCKHIKEK